MMMDDSTLPDLPEGFEVAELQFRVGRLEGTENKRLADLEDRAICLEEAIELTHPQRFEKLETRAICLEQVIETLTQRIDLLNREIFHLKAQR